MEKLTGKYNLVDPRNPQWKKIATFKNGRITEMENVPKPDDRLLADEEIDAVFAKWSEETQGDISKEQGNTFAQAIAKAQDTKTEAIVRDEWRIKASDMVATKGLMKDAECQAILERKKREIEFQSIIKRQVDMADKKIKLHRQIIVTEDWWQEFWKQEGLKE